MDTPLRYQMSEYDCGPTTMLNAISFLFRRDEIPPEIIRNIMLYSLDAYGREGAGRSGTSRMAMMFLNNWLHGIGRAGVLPIRSDYIQGDSVFVGEGGRLSDCLKRNGVAVVRLYFDVEHYVLFTGEQDGKIYLFDPYYEKTLSEGPDVVLTEAHPFSYNRIVPVSRFNHETHDLYALGEQEMREAVLLFNEHTMLTPEKTIEYFI